MSNIIINKGFIKRNLVFPVKKRIDQEMLVIFASIIVISEKEKDSPLIDFGTKGGLVNIASQIITLIDNFKFGLDFLVEEEVSSAGILILPAGRKVFAKESAIFQWHRQIPDPRDIGISKEDYDKGDWSKAEYLSKRSFNETPTETFFDLMVNKKLLYANEMKDLGIVHEIIP